MIPFNVPAVIGNEIEYLQQAILSEKKLSGDGSFTKKCQEWMELNFDTPKALLTTSCTHALEMAAILAEIQPGDEVIAPSFTHSSTVNAFILRGAKISFVDIRPDTLNINEELIEEAITKNTKAIIPVHYAGVACELDEIIDIANHYKLLVIEDAAQGVMATYKNQVLGTIGDIGCYSFHDTKNYSMGEGGAIVIQNENFHDRAEIIREKGIDNHQYFRRQTEKFSWIDIGSSYLPSELNAAYLYAQFEEADLILNTRLRNWERYYNQLIPLQDKNLIDLPYVPEYCDHNANMFYIKCHNSYERTKLLHFLNNRDISAAYHYMSLHTSKAGFRYGKFYGSDTHTLMESSRLLRLPMYYGLTESEVDQVCEAIHDFYANK